jgi:X-X-X-Leu-X-X-Gly heptad repeat protein
LDPAQLSSSVVLSSGLNTLFSGSGPLAVGSQPFAFEGTLPAGNYKLRVETRVRSTQATLDYHFSFNVPEASQILLAGAALLLWIASRRQRA